MTTIKSYTDIEQSRKLAEILPIESADMRFCFSHTLGGRITGHYPMIGREPSLGTIPCWSIAALLSVLPKIGAEEPMIRKLYYANGSKERYICEYSLTNITSEYDNPIDACHEMILNLHERKLL